MSESGSESEYDERGFVPGTHVLVEMVNERRLAGNVIGWTPDGGMYLSATHRESRMIRTVSDEFREEIRGTLDGMSTGKLRKVAVRSGMFWLVVLNRKRLTDALVKQVEREVLEDAEDGVRLRELSVPVKMFVDGGSISTIESTEDALVESGVSMLEAALGNILNNPDMSSGSGWTEKEK